MDGFLLLLTLLAALGCGMIAGVFFAFSTFVMKGLGRLPTEQGVAAMQSINVAAISPVFMASLFGTAAVCGVLAASGLLAWEERYAPYLLVGGVLYLLGTIGLTVLYHVPRNEALARVEGHGPGAERHWRRYLSGWTAANHIRAAAALLAAATLTIALYVW